MSDNPQKQPLADLSAAINSTLKVVDGRVLTGVLKSIAAQFRLIYPDQTTAAAQLQAAIDQATDAAIEAGLDRQSATHVLAGAIWSLGCSNLFDPLVKLL